MFTLARPTFVERNPRDDTDDDQSGIQKMLTRGIKANGFATDQCLGCGKRELKVNVSGKGKACSLCG